MSKRKHPNILICGTPGTGKTTFAQLICEENTTFKHYNISDLVKQHKLHDGFDDEHDSYILDEDKVVDYLEDELGSDQGGCIVDFHTVDFFPERYFDHVIVLRTDNSILYQRLGKRNYDKKKITENVQAEIMQVVFDEAMDSYKPEIILELQSNTNEDMEKNIANVLSLISKW
jgi:adenylate kinase